MPNLTEVNDKLDNVMSMLNNFEKRGEKTETVIPPKEKSEKDPGPQFAHAVVVKYMDPKLVTEPFRPVCNLIYTIAKEFDKNLPDNAEKAVGLRKLLEAKEAFLRSMIKLS